MVADTHTHLAVLPVASVAPPAERERLVRRARMLAWVGLGWHVAEAAAGLVVLWLLTGARSVSERAERRAQQLIAASFLVLAAYVGVEAVRDLFGGHHPEASWVGVGLAIVTLAAMPPLAAAKRRVAERLGSSATASESRQTMLCAYLSAGLLAGLLANAVAGWWWADPIVALGIGAVALREARAAWRGESSDCCA